MATAKKKSAAKKPRPGRLYVAFEVLQNGATLLNAERKIRRSGSLSLKASGASDLSIPYYPLPNQEHEFLRFDHGRPMLVAAHKWEGFCTSKGEMINISRTDKGRREIQLHKGDYASISYEDLRIMVRVGPRRSQDEEAKGGTQSAYRRGFASHFFPTIEEKRLALVGLVVASVIIGGFVTGLLRRHAVKPTKFQEIADSYTLPFIAADHLRNGPEALQEHLDRSQTVRSVIDYYHATTATLMGWEGAETRMLHPTSIEIYQELHAKAEAVKAEKFRRQQEIDRLQTMKSAAAVVAIPAVQGESMTGSMLRVIDKIGIMHVAFNADLLAKREVVKEFANDPDYNPEEYKNVGAARNDQAKEYLSKIRPWGRTPDEELMYLEATRLADRADKARKRLKTASGEIVSSQTAPIGLAEGARFASFAYDVNFMVADEKLSQLQGSEYGASPGPAAKAVAREPLVGQIERSLIDKVIQQQKFQLQLCYELALKRNELVGGTMEWRWRIDTRGNISDISLVSSSIRDNRMTQCIRDKISQWRFPRPRRGSVEISYPFEFAPSRG